jgi:hypothetical protein
VSIELSLTNLNNYESLKESIKMLTSKEMFDEQIKIYEQNSSVISLMDVEKVIKDIFNDKKVSSVSTLYEKEDGTVVEEKISENLHIPFGKNIRFETVKGEEKLLEDIRALVMEEKIESDIEEQQEEIKSALIRSEYTFSTDGGTKHKIKNTNKLLQSYLTILGGKTGYTEEAGFCLANMVAGENGGGDIVVVILGAKSEEQRFQQNKF